jgi:tRNA nucleotidyltransferase (CCA-adding enzyme)
MQEVDPVYTRVSIETGKRIENQLSNRLEKKEITASFRLQGSVPLNIHIKGVSDVDILTIDEQLFVFSNEGSKANSYVLSKKKL